MRILLTNDDGYQAKGLLALYEQLAQEHEVTVVAPEAEQSAIGHAITVNEPIRVMPLENMPGFAVRGTPADCVKLAIYELLSQPPELVLSGINHGANVGANILYSGTVSAASDAAILGWPAIAFSQEFYQPFDFSQAAGYARKLVNSFFKLNLSPGLLLNVNVPSNQPIKGVRLVKQSNARLAECFQRYVDPRGRVYYWPAGETMSDTKDPDDDHYALSQGYITITPVRHDLTHYQQLESLRENACLLPQP